ncbi:hypothetical protein [Streptomyces sp. CB02923]|uniref:hypothetical protein n=1 Tax=Streptomyces sp. CB02923 TaxID=1718985 RepID=UPI0018FFC65A|nr:hypothetical protein [Streptomyces sp. CB02923]
MFELRAEAEMRLFSEKLARKLAAEQSRAPDNASGDAAEQPSESEERRLSSGR